MTTIGERIQAARKDAGVSLRALAEQVELDHTAIGRIENGQRRVASHELFDLAEALGVTTAQLLGQETRSTALAMAARLGAESRPEFLDQAVDRVTQVLEMDDLLSRVAGPGKAPSRLRVDVPESGSPNAQGKALAAAARTALGLGTAPVADLTDVLETRFGVHVIAQPIAGDVHGICVSDGSVAVVLINSSDRWARQRFTLAHELAHLLCEDLEVYEVTWEAERQTAREKRADAFAAHFIAPDEGIREVVAGRKVDAAVVAELTEYFGMSLEAMCWRLVNLRLLTRPDADTLRASGVRSVIAAAALTEAYDQRALAAEGKVVAPRNLVRRALDAYARGVVGVGVLSAVTGEPDLGLVRARLEEAGVRPTVVDVEVGAALV